MKKVLIDGVAYGLHNIGDEAILQGMLDSFAGTYDVSVSTYGSEWIDEEYPTVKRIPVYTMYDKAKLGLTAVPRRKLLASIKNTFFPDLSRFSGVDLMLCGGGTILSDCPWHSLHMVELATKCDVPAVLWGVGMAEVFDAETRERIRIVCSKELVKHIYARDEMVRERLIKYGVPAAKVDVCYDPAYILQGKPGIDFLDERGTRLYQDTRPNLCVSLSGEPDVTDTHHISQVRDYISRVTEFANVFLVPTGLGDKCRDRELLAGMQVNDRVVFVDRELRPTQLIALLEHMQLIVSSRLHCSIFGVDAGAPSINLIRNTKHEDFAALFGLPALKMNQVTADELLQMTGRMLQEYPQLRENLCSKLETIKKTYNAACRQVCERYL